MTGARPVALVAVAVAIGGCVVAGPIGALPSVPRLLEPATPAEAIVVLRFGGQPLARLIQTITTEANYYSVTVMDGLTSVGTPSPAQGVIPSPPNAPAAVQIDELPANVSLRFEVKLHRDSDRTELVGLGWVDETLASSDGEAATVPIYGYPFGADDAGNFEGRGAAYMAGITQAATGLVDAAVTVRARFHLINPDTYTIAAIAGAGLTGCSAPAITEARQGPIGDEYPAIFGAVDVSPDDTAYYLFEASFTGCNGAGDFSLTATKD